MRAERTRRGLPSGRGLSGSPRLGIGPSGKGVGMSWSGADSGLEGNELSDTRKTLENRWTPTPRGLL